MRILCQWVVGGKGCPTSGWCVQLFQEWVEGGVYELLTMPEGLIPEVLRGTEAGIVDALCVSVLMVEFLPSRARNVPGSTRPLSPSLRSLLILR